MFHYRFDDSPCPNYYDICCETPVRTTTNRRKPCGYHQTYTDVTERITRGSKIADFGEFPWTILISQKTSDKTDKTTYICGGSLIHPQVVITASHCVSALKPDQITIRAGEWNVKSTDEPLPHQDNKVDEIALHPHYKTRKLWNDIALLFLKEAFIEANNIGYICVPPPGFKLPNNANCLASGWGRNAFAIGRHSSILRKVALPIVARRACQTALRNTRLGKFFQLHKSFICAGGEANKDTCKGDGGSPLVCSINRDQSDRFVQVGIVSWGIGCGTDRTPGVYVNLALFSSWIDRLMSKKNYDTSYYKYII